MAVLSDNDRALCSATYQRNKDVGAFASVLKADLRAAVNGLDQYLSDNAAAINTAIPQPARAQLTTVQKALLLVHVIEQRYLSGV